MYDHAKRDRNAETGPICAEDGWKYLGDGAYYRLSRDATVEVVAYNGIEVSDRVVLDSVMIYRLHTEMASYLSGG